MVTNNVCILDLSCTYTCTSMHAEDLDDKRKRHDSIES